jgi:hypothetical protein
VLQYAIFLSSLVSCYILLLSQVRIVDSKYSNGIPKLNVYIEEYVYYVPAFLWFCIFWALFIYQIFILVDGLNQIRSQFLWLMSKGILLSVPIAYALVTIDAYCKEIGFYSTIIETVILCGLYISWIMIGDLTVKRVRKLISTSVVTRNRAPSGKYRQLALYSH